LLFAGKERAEQLLQLMGDGLVYLRITGALSFFQALSLTFSASLRSADNGAVVIIDLGHSSFDNF
jgi:Na+-driven multidrug efflux pump